MPPISIPQTILDNVGHVEENQRWLNQLPTLIGELQEQWNLILESPFEKGRCSWVAPCMREDGTSAVLKIGLPHMEARDEIAGLLFWNGNPTVRVLNSSLEANAFLLERCHPGTSLRQLSEPKQDEVIARLLHRLWRTPSKPHSFRPLSEMTSHWSIEALETQNKWPDRGIGEEGIRLFAELPKTTINSTLLATDLHAGNVLKAEREPWLMIDPKPFLGDPAYDATQHLLNCMERLEANPNDTIYRFADLLEIEQERIKLWMFARLALQSKERKRSHALARKLLMS